MATERVFFGYGWFYNLEDGYLPCPAGIECDEMRPETKAPPREQLFARARATRVFPVPGGP